MYGEQVQRGASLGALVFVIILIAFLGWMMLSAFKATITAINNSTSLMQQELTNQNLNASQSSDPFQQTLVSIGNTSYNVESAIASFLSNKLVIAVLIGVGLLSIALAASRRQTY